MQMDEQALIERLDCCLLSDEEMALGPQAWQSWSNLLNKMMKPC